MVNCNICFEKIKKENLVYIKCNHTFHLKCFQDSMFYNNVCPYCREPLKLLYIEDCSNCGIPIIFSYYTLANQHITGVNINSKKKKDIKCIIKNQNIFCQTCF